MTGNQIRITLLGGFALVAALIASRPVAAQNATQPYPNMAPIEQYLMDRDAEIALARSAALESISRDAEVLVLGRHGFETAVKGENGFVCGSNSFFCSSVRISTACTFRGRAQPRFRRYRCKSLESFSAP